MSLSLSSACFTSRSLWGPTQKTCVSAIPTLTSAFSFVLSSSSLRDGPAISSHPVQIICSLVMVGGRITVDYHILVLNRLKMISFDESLSKSQFSHRQSRWAVVLHDNPAVVLVIWRGIPQGWTFAPLLFALYMNGWASFNNKQDL